MTLMEPKGIRVSDQEDRFLLKDALDFFSGRKSGHMGTHAYSEPKFANDPAGGAVYWRAFIKMVRDYYLLAEEADLIAKFARAANDVFLDSNGQAIANSHFVDLGPGEREAVWLKTLPFIQASTRPRGYLAIDTNPAFAEAAAQLVDDETSVKSAEAQTRDFLRDMLEVNFPSPVIFLLFGGYLCNLASNGKSSAAKLRSNFDSLRNNMSRNDYLVVTQDTNNDEASLLRAYDHPVVGQFMLSVLHRIKRDLTTHNFNPEDFSARIYWDKEHKTLKVSAVADKSMAFTIGGHPFSVIKGTELCISNSYKFPLTTFIDAAREAGFESRSTFNPNSRIALHVLQAV